MPDLSVIEPIRYTQDLLIEDKSGLLVSAVPLNASALTQIDAVTISGTEPAGTSRRFLLSFGENGWQKWNGAAFEAVFTQSLTAGSVLSEGNTAVELTALTVANLNPLAGEIIHVAIALHAEDPEGVMPTAGLSITGQSEGQITEKTVLSPSLTLSSSEAVEVLDIAVESEAINGGSVTVEARKDGGEWEDPAGIVGKTAGNLDFRAVLRAPSVGVSEASIDSTRVRHKSDTSKLATGRASVISKTYDFSQVDGTPIDMSQAHLMVKRLDIPETEVNAYLALRPTPKKVPSEVLGTGDGNQHTYTLENISGLAQHTLKIYFGNEEQGSDKYAFSSATGQITCTPPEGVTVWVEYEWGWEPETWFPMTRDRTYPDTDNPYVIADQFSYTAGDEDPQGSVASVRVDLVQLTGTATDEPLGEGTGASFAYRPEHTPDPETLKVKVGGENSDAWYYDPVTNLLTVSASRGVAITATYEWKGRQPSADSVACVWNV